MAILKGVLLEEYTRLQKYISLCKEESKKVSALEDISFIENAFAGNGLDFKKELIKYQIENVDTRRSGWRSRHP